MSSLYKASCHWLTSKELVVPMARPCWRLVNLTPSKGRPLLSLSLWSCLHGPHYPEAPTPFSCWAQNGSNSVGIWWNKTKRHSRPFVVNVKSIRSRLHTLGPHDWGRESNRCTWIRGWPEMVSNIQVHIQIWNVHIVKKISQTTLTCSCFIIKLQGKWEWNDFSNVNPKICWPLDFVESLSLEIASSNHSPYVYLIQTTFPSRKGWTLW